MFLRVCDYHRNRLLVLWGTRSLAHEMTGAEGVEETHRVIIITTVRAWRQTTTLTLEQVEVGLQRTDRETDG